MSSRRAVTRLADGLARKRAHGGAVGALGVPKGALGVPSACTQPPSKKVPRACRRYQGRLARGEMVGSGVVQGRGEMVGWAGVQGGKGTGHRNLT